MRLGVIFLSLLVAVVFVAGCGSGGSSGSSSSGGSTAASTAKEGKGEEGGKGEEEGVANEEAAEGKESEGEEAGGEKEKASPEKAALIKEGDEICGKVPKAYGKKVKALEKKNGGKKPSTKEANLAAAVPPLYTAAEELEQLTAPSGEEEQLAAIIAALEAAAKGLEAKPNSPLSGPKSPFNEFQELTGEYGFQVCSQL